MLKSTFLHICTLIGVGCLYWLECMCVGCSVVGVIKISIRSAFKNFAFLRKIFINLFLQQFIKFFQYTRILPLQYSLDGRGLVCRYIVGGLVEGER